MCHICIGKIQRRFTKITSSRISLQCAIITNNKIINMPVHNILFNCEKFIVIKRIRQPVLFDSEYPMGLYDFVVEASDQELLLGQAYSNLNDVRSCGQFQGIPFPDALN